MEGIVLMIEDIHQSLKEVFDEFDKFCRDNSCLYNIVSDEPDRQGYVLHDRKHEKALMDYIGPVLHERGVHVEISPNRTDGVLFTFTLATIQDGHWKPLSKQRKRHEFSFFVKDDDAKAVRNGETIYQTKFLQGLSEALAPLALQTSKPSTKNTPTRPAGNISGNSIYPQIERPSSLGTASAARSTDLTTIGKGGSEFQSYKTRKDLTDLPTAPPSHVEDFLHRLEILLKEGDSPVPADANERSIITNKEVPDAGMQQETPVIPDDTVSRAALDPTGGLQSSEITGGVDTGIAQQQTLTALGSGNSENMGGPGPNTPHSNVRVKGGASGGQFNAVPQIAVTTPPAMTEPDITGIGGSPDIPFAVNSNTVGSQKLGKMGI